MFYKYLRSLGVYGYMSYPTIQNGYSLLSSSFDLLARAPPPPLSNDDSARTAGADGT